MHEEIDNHLRCLPFKEFAKGATSSESQIEPNDINRCDRGSVDPDSLLTAFVF